jgi:glycosyltransferase involved in cell wall biosynthesis
MIALRILQVATSLSEAKTGDVLSTMAWLKQQGHEVAIAAGGDDDIPGATVLRYRKGTASWWLGGKRAWIEQVSAWRPDIIHLHGVAALSAARAAAKALALPIVVSVEAVVSGSKVRALRDAHISWIFVPTEAHRAHYVGRLKFSRDNVTQLPFTFSREELLSQTARKNQQQASTNSSTNPLSIGCLAQSGDGQSAELFIEQFIEPFIEQCEQLLADPQLPRFQVVIGYDESIAAEQIHARVREKKNRPWCRLIACPRCEELLPEIDLFIQPSGIRHVAPIIAALGAGRTVLAVNETGVDELITHEKTGVIVPPNDPAALKTALLSLLSDQALRTRLAHTAENDARKRFAIDVVGPVLVALYRNAINAAHHPEDKGEGSRAYKRQLTQ